MTVHKKTLVGCWFGFGVVLTYVLVLFHFHTPINSLNWLGVGLSLIIGTAIGNSCGQVWGLVIIRFDAQIFNFFRAIGYGMLIGIVTLYAIILVMTFISYLQTGFLDMLHQAAYLKIIISFIQIPGLALFGLVMGCIFEPLVLSMSGLGGGLLYLLRHRLETLCESQT